MHVGAPAQQPCCASDPTWSACIFIFFRRSLHACSVEQPAARELGTPAACCSLPELSLVLLLEVHCLLPVRAQVWVQQGAWLA